MGTSFGRGAAALGMATMATNLCTVSGNYAKFEATFSNLCWELKTEYCAASSSFV